MENHSKSWAFFDSVSRKCAFGFGTHRTLHNGREWNFSEHKKTYEYPEFRATAAQNKAIS